MTLHGREWVDVFSYHPLLFLPPVRVYRDEAVIAAADAANIAMVQRDTMCR